MEKGDIEWEPIKGQIMSRWVQDVNPELPLPEYPRPQLKREKWLSLNGLWEYAITKKDFIDVPKFEGKILVPFPLESALSGVGRKLKPHQKLWYHRIFHIPEDWRVNRVLLHFGAVDWESNIWINGNKIGEHKGGFTPFHYDVSEWLKDGENHIMVTVWDPTNKGMQEYGKQSLNPGLIFYNAVSGIWQTVWLEPVPKTYVEDVLITSDIDKESITINTLINWPKTNDMLEIEIFDENKQISRVMGVINQEIKVDLNSPKLWSPVNPFLYTIIIRIRREREIIDDIKSYFGMRKVNLSKAQDGVFKIELNNEFLFQFGALDQGYWPDGLYTAPTDEALKYDILITKELGFNLIRKHVKVEPARWYYYCDKIGILVWQDMPNGGVTEINDKPLTPDTVKNYKTKREESDKQNYYNELSSMIRSLRFFPSIIVWVPFNEGWGQFETDKVTDMIRQLDPTRLIDSASGWFDYGLGDIYDRHNYPNPILPNLDEAQSRALVLGEFGGLSLEINNHMWKSNSKFQYVAFPNSTKLAKRYERLILKLKGIIENGLTAAIYTQIIDVEGEVNGLLTYDRELLKFDKEKIKEINLGLFSE